MNTWRLRFVLSAFGLAAIALACGPGFLDGISGGTADAGAADGSITNDSGPSCDSRVAPGPPSGLDDVSRHVELPTFAFEHMRFDTFGSPDAGGPPPFGLDQDRTCTCPGPDSCIRPAGRDASCDGPRGEDNSLARLFNELNVGVPLFPQTFATDRIRSGFFNVLIDVRGWNGEPNDPKVSVTLRLSQYSEEKMIPGDGGRERPVFDGKDVWTVDPTSVSGGDAAIGTDCRTSKDFTCLPRVRDDNAYVVNGKLVARPRLDSVPDGVTPISVRSSAGSITFGFFDFTVVADITGTGESARLSGEMAGRVASSNVIETFANMQDFTKPNEPPICESPAVFALAKLSVCGARDLPAPGRGADTACDYISVAFSFGASPAVAGTIFRKDTDPPPCGEQQYSCD